jgi:hypothetical protein
MESVCLISSSDVDIAYVNALGVVLGTVDLACRVQSNDLVTEDVLSSSDARGDSNSEGQVVGNELVGSPLAILETSRIDLEELQVLRSGLGGIINLGKVVDDGANVGGGPCVPLNINAASGGDLSDLGTSGGILVARDLVHVGVHGGVNKAIVLALRAAPLNHLRGGSLVLERRVVGSVGGAIDADSREMAVSADRGGESADKGSNLDLVRHVVDCWNAGIDGKSLVFKNELRGQRR